MGVQPFSSVQILYIHYLSLFNNTRLSVAPHLQQYPTSHSRDNQLIHGHFRDSHATNDET